MPASTHLTPYTTAGGAWLGPLLLGLSLVLGACESISGAKPGGPGGGKPGAQATKAEQNALEVPVTAVEPATIERYYETSGTLRAVREADIVATQVGVLQAVRVEEGDTVQRGQAIAKLDGRELSLQAAAAQLQASNLKRELERLESAAPAGIITEEEVAKQRYAVEEALATARLQKFQAKQSTVRAPFEGTVVERYVDEGALANTATPLFRIADLSALELELHLPERDAASVSKAAPVEITLVDEQRFTAAIVREAPIVDAMTGTVKFTVRAETFPATAKPGAFARARVLIDRRDEVPTLPRSAVFEVEGQWNVFVIVDAHAKRQAVEVGLMGDERVEIAGGLPSDAVVVREGNAGVTEGMPLRAAQEA